MSLISLRPFTSKHGTLILLDSTKLPSTYSILKPGGIWINLGPLLYHYSDSETESSIEPSCEELVEIIQAVGFEIMTNEPNVQTKYTQNRRSMYQSTYSSIFLVCRKNALPIYTPMTTTAKTTHDQ